MSFKKNLFRVFSANFLSLISGIVIGFVIPGILSIESYSYLKTYVFYITYITCFHFGYVDGIYMKYGGKRWSEINLQELKCDHNILFVIQIFITFIIFLVGIINKDIIIILLATSILPINLLSFHYQLYQSVGEFKKFSGLSLLYTICYFVLNMILAIFFKSENYILYCLTTVISNLIVFFIAEYNFFKKISNIKFIYDKKVWNNIKIGIYILIGNFAVISIYAIDRWYVKIFYGIDDFAYYSFAVSMLNIINTLITSISAVFYNYLFNNREKSKLRKVKLYLIILASFVMISYFGLSFVVNTFLNKYVYSLNILINSFVGYPYIIVINSLYINLYKIDLNKNKYLKSVIVVIIISIIYNSICILFKGSLEMIALSATCTFISWYIYSGKDFKYLKSDKKEILYLGIISLSFLLSSHLKNWVVGGVLYFLLFFITTFGIYKNEGKEIFINEFKLNKILSKFNEK